MGLPQARDPSYPRVLRENARVGLGRGWAELLSLESRRMTRPWTGRETSASSQTFEFRLWAALTEQSPGQLHVFLPTGDRGAPPRKLQCIWSPQLSPSAASTSSKARKWRFHCSLG